MMASGKRRRNRPDIRAQLTGSLANADRWFGLKIKDATPSFY
jgi:hypothetical protein